MVVGGQSGGAGVGLCIMYTILEDVLVDFMGQGMHIKRGFLGLDSDLGIVACCVDRSCRGGMLMLGQNRNIYKYSLNIEPIYRSDLEYPQYNLYFPDIY